MNKMGYEALTESWIRIFDDMLGFAKREKPASEFNGLVMNAGHIQPADVELQSEIEIWGLFENGIRTLRKDKYSKLRGNLDLACQRISLRNTPLAHSLGVQPPRYESETLEAPSDKEHPALIKLDILFDTAEKDLEKSRDILVRTLNFVQKHSDQVSHLTPHQQMIFSYLTQSHDTDIKDKPSEDGIIDDPVHHQMAITLKSQIKAYKKVHARFSDALNSLSAP